MMRDMGFMAPAVDVDHNTLHSYSSAEMIYANTAQQEARVGHCANGSQPVTGTAMTGIDTLGPSHQSSLSTLSSELDWALQGAFNDHQTADGGVDPGPLIDLRAFTQGPCDWTAAESEQPGSSLQVLDHESNQTKTAADSENAMEEISEATVDRLMERILPLVRAEMQPGKAVSPNT
jgi:hypothetical protein